MQSCSKDHPQILSIKQDMLSVLFKSLVCENGIVFLIQSCSIDHRLNKICIMFVI